MTHYKKLLLLSFAQCHITYTETVSTACGISPAHLSHFEHQLLVCDVWDCHDVIYAHHPFYIPRTPQTALLNQEYMSEFISTNT